MSAIHFKLTDAWGKEHEYTCEEFSVDEQADLHADVAPILAGPLARVLGAAFAVQKTTSEIIVDPAGSVWEKIQRVMSGFNYGELAEALQLLPKLLKEAAPDRKPSAFYARVLAKTKRAIAAETTGGSELQISTGYLSDPRLRDQAYGGGNILELYKAVLHVIAVHFGPFGRSGSPLLSELSQMLQALLLLQPKETETPPQKSGGNSASAPQSG